MTTALPVLIAPKTTTLLEAAKRGTPTISFIAFNKAVAAQLKGSK